MEEVTGTSEKVCPEILSERSFSIFRQAYELLTTEKGEERERERERERELTFPIFSVSGMTVNLHSTCTGADYPDLYH